MCAIGESMKEGVPMKAKRRTYGHRVCLKKRFFIFLTLLIAGSFWAGGYVNADDAGSDISAGMAYIEVEVSHGNTLWQIAGDHNPEGKDIRRFIYEISEINGIENGLIHPGDIIRIPVDG
jgi:hypothetical protein